MDRASPQRSRRLSASDRKAKRAAKTSSWSSLKEADASRRLIGGESTDFQLGARTSPQRSRRLSASDRIEEQRSGRRRGWRLKEADASRRLIVAASFTATNLGKWPQRSRRLSASDRDGGAIALLGVFRLKEADASRRLIGGVIVVAVGAAIFVPQRSRRLSASDRFGLGRARGYSKRASKKQTPLGV